MSKVDELKKEANLKYRTGSYPQLYPDWRAFEHGYLAGAEPREKRIAELEKENAELRGICKGPSDKLDSIMLQIETNIRKAFSKCNGLELLLICKVVDIVRNTLSEEWKNENTTLEFKLRGL